VPTAIVAFRLLVNHSDPERARIDVPGVLTASAGLFALVYGFSNAETSSWTAPATIVALLASPLLLLVFVTIERRAAHPLLPLHIVWNRARGGPYVSIVLAGAGMFGVFLFLTYFMQQTLDLSPLTTGVAFLPMSMVLVLTSTTVQTQVLQHTGVRPLVITGMSLGLIAMLLLTRLTPSSTYASNILPALIILGVGVGCIFAPAFSTATLGVATHEAGIASAMVNTSQQIGGSVGTALLSTLFASAAAGYAAGHAHVAGLAGAALVYGYATAFWWASGIFAVGLLLALLILPKKSRPRAAAIPVPVGAE
jgi:predicted MFS family arabinose efflux permease